MEIFESIIKEKNIIIEYDMPDDIFYNMIEEDLYMALTNIIENAIFWDNYSKQNNKIIIVILFKNTYFIFFVFFFFFFVFLFFFFFF